jgi:LIM homeobox protein 2/9
LNKLAGYCSNQDVIDHNNNNEKLLEEQANSARSFNIDSKEPNGFYLPVSSSDSYLAKNKSKSNGPISSSGRKTNMLMNSSSGTSSSSAHSKKKRMRTSFKHQQLRIMKAHFQINQNPDSKELKELSEKTGLPKRVLQVLVLFYICLITKPIALISISNRSGFKIQELSSVKRLQLIR